MSQMSQPAPAPVMAAAGWPAAAAARAPPEPLSVLPAALSSSSLARALSPAPSLPPPAKDTLSAPPLHHHHDGPRRGSVSSLRSHASARSRHSRSHSPYPSSAPSSAPGARSLLARTKTTLHNNRGLLLILLSQFFASLMSLTTRLLETGFPSQKFHAIQILFARQSITMVGCLVWMWWKRIPDAPFGAPGVRMLLVARGLGGFWGVFGLYYSLTYLNLSDATVITFLAPIVASYACSVIPALREPFTRTEVIAGITSLTGVVLIARPASLFEFGRAGDDPGYDETLTPESPARRGIFPGTDEKLRVLPHQRLIAVLVALVGVLGAATAYTTIRWIGKRAHPLISVNYFATWCTLVSLTSLLFLPSVGGIVWPRSLLQWSLLLGIGVTGFAMQFLLTAGLQLERAGRGTNMVYTQMLFALFWERVVWGTTPNVLSIVGSTLIMGAVLWVGLRRGNTGEEAVGGGEGGRGGVGRFVFGRSVAGGGDEEMAMLARRSVSDDSEGSVSDVDDWGDDTWQIGDTDDEEGEEEEEDISDAKKRID